MVIQTRIHDGIAVKTRTYRNVIDGVNLAQFREGFYAQKAYSRFGIMVQLKGKERITLAAFGVPDVDAHRLEILTDKRTQIVVIDQSTTYLGRFVETIDTYDGSFGDEDYEAYDRIYYSLELEEAK